MPHLKQLCRSIQQFRAASLERELIAACHRPIITSLELHSALQAAEGLFLASIISTTFWSVLIFTLFCCH
jgi:hypothetical protein